MKKNLILVVGGTGSQGGAVINGLLDAGLSVRALVRDKTKEAAKTLEARGVELVEGDMSNPESLVSAMVGVTGVFSNGIFSSSSKESSGNMEVVNCSNLINSAKAAGVEIFVHSSVARAGEHKQFVDWDKGRWPTIYWEGKSEINELVRKAGFPYYTILKPAFMMDNLIIPAVLRAYPTLSEGKLVTAYSSDTKLDWTSADQVARFAVAAFANPLLFNKKEIDLAEESLTIHEVGEILQQVTGKQIKVYCLSVEEAVEKGAHRGFTEAQDWANVVGYKVNLAQTKNYGIQSEDFKHWLERHKEQLNIEND